MTKFVLGTFRRWKTWWSRSPLWAKVGTITTTCSPGITRPANWAIISTTSRPASSTSSPASVGPTTARASHRKWCIVARNAPVTGVTSKSGDTATATWRRRIFANSSPWIAPRKSRQQASVCPSGNSPCVHYKSRPRYVHIQPSPLYETPWKPYLTLPYRVCQYLELFKFHWEQLTSCWSEENAFSFTQSAS